MGFLTLSTTKCLDKSLPIFVRTLGAASKNVYVYLSLSTNLAFVTFPYLGSSLIKSELALSWGTAFTFILAVASYWLLKHPHSLATIHTAETSTTQESNPSAQNSFFSKDIMSDALRFLAAIFPYAFMIALMPIKATSEENGVHLNSIAMAINSGTVILIQLLATKTSFLKYSVRRYDLFSIGAVATCLIAPFVSFNIALVLFFLWSICEAYQLPNIDHLLFSDRNYSSRAINQILALDAVVCFLGPILAGIFR